MTVYKSSSCRSLGLGVNQFGPRHADVMPHMIVQFLWSPSCNPSIRDHIIFRGRCYASSKLLVSNENYQTFINRNSIYSDSVLSF